MTSTILKSDVMDKILHRLLDLGKFLDFHENCIMDTEISAQLQKVEMWKTIKAFDYQRNREFWNSLSKDNRNKDSRLTTV